jgi:hypothetical protein
LVRPHRGRWSDAPLAVDSGAAAILARNYRTAASILGEKQLRKTVELFEQGN